MGGGREGAILQQHHAFNGTFEGELCKLLATELGIVGQTLRGMVEEVETVLHAEYAAHCIVDTAHGNLSFVDQFLQQDAGINAIGFHDHVDTSIDGNAKGILLVAGHHLTGIEVVHVGPVGDEHTVPSRLLLQPYGEQLAVGMDGHTVDRRRVDHDRVGTSLDTSKEGREELLTQLGGCDIGRRAVLARPRHAVTHIVLQRHGHVLLVYMVGIFALEAKRLGHAHLGIDIAVLAEVLVESGPAGIAGQVEGRTERPGHAHGTGLVGRGLGTATGNVAIERCSHVDVLREKRAALRIGGTVVLVETEEAGNAAFAVLVDAAHRVRRQPVGCGQLAASLLLQLINIDTAAISTYPQLIVAIDVERMYIFIDIVGIGHQVVQFANLICRGVDETDAVGRAHGNLSVWKLCDVLHVVRSLSMPSDLPR